MNLKTLVTEYRPKILALAKECKIKEVFVFGSVARGDEKSGSDVDLMITPEPSCGWAVGKFLLDVQDLLGCKVDIVFSSSRFAKMISSDIVRL